MARRSGVMHNVRFAAGITLGVVNSIASADAASIADVLFRGVANAQVLPPTERAAIAALLPLAAGPQGQLVDTTCRQDASPLVTLADINRDGSPEVVVTEGNACVYGMAGRVTHLLARDSRGRWREILKGDGETVGDIQPAARTGAWPDIMPPVPGFCYPVYGYSDAQQRYVLKGRVPDPKMPAACRGL